MRRCTASVSPSSSSISRYLPRRPTDAMDRPASSSAKACGSSGSTSLASCTSTRVDAAPRDALGELRADRLDLGQLRHRVHLDPARRHVAGLLARPRVAGVDDGERLALVDRARPRRTSSSSPTTGSIDWSGCRRPAPSQRATSPTPRASMRRTVPADGEITSMRSGALGSARSSVQTAGSPPWASTHRSAAARAVPSARAASRAGAPLAGTRDPRRLRQPPAARTAAARSVVGPGPAQHLARLADLERVARRSGRAGRPSAQSDQRHGAPPGLGHPLHQRGRRPRLVLRGDEGPRAVGHLDVQRTGARRQPAGHRRGRHDARGGHRAGGVAQLRQAQVARGEAAVVGRDGDALVAHLPHEVLERAGRSPSPGIASSLSAVPPVCARPRSAIEATRTPRAAASGAATIGVVSPTPPVVPTSPVGPKRPSSRRSPEPTRARSSASAWSSARPRTHASMHQADSSESSEVPSSQERTNDSTLSASTGSPLRLRSTTSTGANGHGHDRPTLHRAPRGRTGPRGGAESRW